MTTTPRKIALVVGPTSWGDRFVTRTGQRLPPLRQPDARDQRRVEAENETRGLAAALTNLPPDCLLLYASSSAAGATRQAAQWAATNGRQTIVVPITDDDPTGAAPLAIELAVVLADAGRKVKALACVHDPDDPVATELRGRGLWVEVVEPAVPPVDEDELTAESV